MALSPETQSLETEFLETQFLETQSPTASHLPVSEFLGEHQGASSPFGDVEFPLSPQALERLGSGDTVAHDTDHA